MMCFGASGVADSFINYCRKPTSIGDIVINREGVGAI